MTYCVGITVDRGLVLASDSRTNAGADQISTFSKMSTFCGDGERFFTLLTAGNLATTQAVVTQIQRDIDKDAQVNLLKVPHLSEAAEYVGQISRTQQEKHAKPGDDSFQVNASFILGGQIAGRPPGLFLIYPEGNYIRACEHTPFLQIGEAKYGKPILDRLISPDMALEDAARCVLVSMDSTMRSNATVGPPIEVRLYPVDSLTAGRHLVLREDDDYLRELRLAWQDSLRRAFNGLPKLPGSPARVRLVDG